MWLLAQDGGGGGAAAAGGAAMGLVMMLFWLVFVVGTIAGMWMTFAKAGKPGWAAIIPIYNMIVLLEIAGRPIWWIILFLIPCVSLVVAIILYIDVAKAFGQGAGFGIGMAFLPFIFLPILGFGSAKYIGPQVS